LDARGRPKTTASAEELRTDIATNTALRRIQSAPGLDAAERNRLESVIRSRAAGVSAPVQDTFWNKIRDIASSRVLSPFKSAYKATAQNPAVGPVVNPVGAAKSIWDLTRDVSRVAQSGLKELQDALTSQGLQPFRPAAISPLNVGGTALNKEEEDLYAELKKQTGDPAKPSWDDFVNQAKDPDWAWRKSVHSEYVKSKNKVAGFIADLGVEIGTDPVSYVTGIGEVKYIGKAGRYLLAEKMLTKEMLAKYPQLAGKANDILRIGVWALPKEVRLAEGINTGIRIAGRPAKFTENLGDFVGPGMSNVRARIGDVISSAGMRAGLNGGVFVRESAKGLVGAGKKAGGVYRMSDEQATAAIANWSARQYSRGEVASSYTRFMDGIRDTIQQAKDEGFDEDLALTLDTIRNRPWTTIPDRQRILAERLGQWQDGLYNAIQDRYRQFGVDFDTVIDPFGWVDNYVHHRITRDARSWIRQNDAFKNKIFRTADLNADDLLNVGQPLRFRKLRKGETFMGETLQYGDIAEVNEIFKRQTGTNIDFFETSGSAVADAYAYSMSKMLGREAWARRLMQYGDTAAQKMIREEVPNKELSSGLATTLRSLNQVRREMVGDMRLKMGTLRDDIKSAVSAAERVVKGKSKEYQLAAGRIAGLSNKLQRLENDLASLRSRAQSIDEAARGSFETQHAVLLGQIKSLRTAIENANGEEAALRMVLQNAYQKMYPQAKRIPEDVEVLADRILAARGAPSSREVRRINQRLTDIRRQLDEGGVDPQLLAEEGRLKDLMNGYRVSSDFRSAQDYAPDNGFLYVSRSGMDTDPFEKPFNLLESNPAAFPTREDIVAVRVIPNDRILDSRTDIGLEQIFGLETFGDEFARQLDAANIDSTIYREGYETAKNLGVIDPEIEEQFPDLADLLDNMMLNSSTQVMPMGEPQLIKDIYDDMVNAATGVAVRAGVPNPEVVGKQLVDSTIGSLARSAQDEGVADGIMLPARLFNEGAELDDVVVVVPPEFRVAPSQSVTADVQDASSPLIKSILDSDFTTASEATAGRLAEISSRTSQVSRNHQALREELKKLRAQKGGIVGAQARRQRTAEEAKVALERLRNGETTVMIGGKKVKLTRTKIEKELEKSLRLEKRLRDNLEREIQASLRGLRTAEGLSLPTVEAKLLSVGERMSALFNEIRLMDAWDAGVGARIKSELQYYGQVLAEMPAVGEAGIASREWVRRVMRSLDTAQIIPDPQIRKSYEMLTDLLHYDEIALAQIDDVITQTVGEKALVDIGAIGPDVAYKVLQGWDRIAGLGIQVPEELVKVWKPNLEKLLKREGSEWRRLREATEWMNKLFKTYAIGTVGFFVRNAYSALFMNTVAGVEGANMARGAKAAFFYRKYGPNKWLDALGITDSAERQLYETAMRARQATGRGMYSDIAEPVIKGTRGEKIINNIYTRAIRRTNESVEDMVRFPMALDTLRKGGDYAEAVQRINRYHFDYSDLSGLDQRALNVIPFWIWTTRNIPTQIANQLMRPRAYAVWENIQETLPVDGELALPAWMQAYEPLGIVGLGGPANIILRPDLPHQRLDEALESIVNPFKLAGMAYPLYKVPIEIAAGRQLGIDTGPFEPYQEAKGIDRALAEILARTPLAGETRQPAGEPRQISGRASYAAGQFLPLIATLQRLSGGRLGGKESYGKRTLAAWLNFFGIPLETIGEPQQRSEQLRRQFDIKDAIKEMVDLNIIPPEK
jgi:hypothetical protein